MPNAGLGRVVRRLREMALLDGAGLSDGELLERYVCHREEAAFTALVRIHGPMVLGVCRRLLRDTHDADDAFQATFLVLVRKAHAIVPRERVGAWLYGVAYRTSLRAKAMANRRRAKQKTLEDVPSPPADPEAEWLALLDHEIIRLPEKYRVPLVLCDLERKTRKQAARQIGCPEGTLATRLQHARALVQKRLARHGLTLSAGAIAVTWTHAVSAAVPSSLLAATVSNASVFTAGKIAGLIPLPIIALAEGVVKAMVLTKVKTIGAVLVLVSALGLGVGGVTVGSRSVAGAQSPGVKAIDAGAPAPAKVSADPQLASDFFNHTEKNDGRLPTGPTPFQALVSLDRDQVVVRTNEPITVPKTTAGTVVTRYETIFTLRTERYNRGDVEVFDIHDTQLRKLDVRDLAKWLKDEIPALVVGGTRAIDPLHLRLIKEGTLLFVLPLPIPAAPQASQPVPVPPNFVTPQNSQEQAERDMAIANFYDKAGQRGAATFYYELICKRYPDSTYAEKARQRLQELHGQDKQTTPPQKTSFRVGQIIIVGNEYLPDTLIREVLALYPGQVLKSKDLEIAEARLHGLKKWVDVRASVQVLDPDGSGEVKDIRVDVQESLPATLVAEMKKLEGSWVVTSVSLPGTDGPNPLGAEFILSGNHLTTISKRSVARHSIVLTPSSEPKGIRCFPIDGPENALPTVGTYEMADNVLKLRLRTMTASASGVSQGVMELTLKRNSTVRQDLLPRLDQKGGSHFTATPQTPVAKTKPVSPLKPTIIEENNVPQSGPPPSEISEPPPPGVIPLPNPPAASLPPPSEAPTKERILDYLNDNARRVQSVRFADVELTVTQGFKSFGLRGTMVSEKTRNFRLSASTLGNPVVDLGSNDQEFWYWIGKADSPFQIYCSYKDLSEGRVRRMPLPFQPEWVMESLGLGTYGPPEKYQQEFDADTIKLVKKSTSLQGRPVRTVIVLKRAAVPFPRPQITDYLLLDDASGKEICGAHISEVQIDRGTGAILPKRIVLRWPSEKLTLALRLDGLELNSQIPRRMFTRPMMPNVQSFNLAPMEIDNTPPPDASGTESKVRPVQGYGP